MCQYYLGQSRSLMCTNQITNYYCFSPSVLGWAKSKCGNVISCVAVCEYIDDPAHVKIRKGDINLTRWSNVGKKILLLKILENAKNCDIPQSYLLITNNEFVRVRYLLIYGSKKVSTVKKSASDWKGQLENSHRENSFYKWLRRNPLIVSVFLYILMLVFVGISKNRAVEYYKNILMQFLQNRFKFLWNLSRNCIFFKQ